MKAVIYLRVSTLEQTRVGEGSEGYSIPAQREACIRLIEDQGWELAEEFVDAGFSATTLKRPALQRMMERLKEDREIKVVVVHKLDRLARQLEGHITIRGALKKLGVRLLSVVERVEENASGQLMEALHAAMAEFYSANLAAQVKIGTTRRVREGYYVGVLPPGYHAQREYVQGRRLAKAVVEEEEAYFVRLAFTLYATGNYTLTELRDLLTQKGFRTRWRGQAKTISRNGLDKLLQNRFYIGEIRYEKVWYPGKHDPLVSKEVFERVGEVLELHNTAGMRQRKHSHYLKGTLHCTCGARLSLTLAKGEYLYFYCLGQKQPGSTCTERYVLASTLEEQVTKLYRKIQLPPKLRDRMREELDKKLVSREARSIDEQKWLTRHFSRLTTERQKVMEAYYAEAIDMRYFKEEQERITQEMAAIEERLRRTRLSIEHVRGIGEVAIRLASSCGDAYTKASPAKRKAFNGALFDRIYVEDGRVSGVEHTELFGLILSRPSGISSSNTDKLVGREGFEPSTLGLREAR